jgi:RNA polymerase sigma-70 factor, ECF subfamily
LLDEENLVRRAQQGETEAFSQLYEAYFDKIYRYMAVRIQNEMEAEDMTQQVFIKMLKSIDSYTIKGIPFSSWLYRIAHNQLIDHYRMQNKRATVPIDEIPERANDDDPQRNFEQKMDVEQLMQATKKLTAAQQEVISLRFTGELSIAECAEIMGKSEGAIKALQHSAVLALRKTLMAAEL